MASSQDDDTPRAEPTEYLGGNESSQAPAWPNEPSGGLAGQSGARTRPSPFTNAPSSLPASLSGQSGPSTAFSFSLPAFTSPWTPWMTAAHAPSTMSSRDQRNLRRREGAAIEFQDALTALTAQRLILHFSRIGNNSHPPRNSIDLSSPPAHSPFLGSATAAFATTSERGPRPASQAELREPGTFVGHTSQPHVPAPAYPRPRTASRPLSLSDDNPRALQFTGPRTCRLLGHAGPESDLKSP